MGETFPYFFFLSCFGGGFKKKRVQKSFIFSGGFFSKPFCGAFFIGGGRLGSFCFYGAMLNGGGGGFSGGKTPNKPPPKKFIGVGAPAGGRRIPILLFGGFDFMH